jgi:hypothetical protein
MAEYIPSIKSAISHLLDEGYDEEAKLVMDLLEDSIDMKEQLATVELCGT